MPTDHLLERLTVFPRPLCAGARGGEGAPSAQEVRGGARGERPVALLRQQPDLVLARTQRRRQDHHDLHAHRRPRPHLR
eukprot:1047021-Pyramimonas_sp.AAC.1